MTMNVVITTVHHLGLHVHVAPNTSRPEISVNISTTNWNFYKKINAVICHSYLRVA